MMPGTNSFFFFSFFLFVIFSMRNTVTVFVALFSLVTSSAPILLWSGCAHSPRAYDDIFQNMCTHPFPRSVVVFLRLIFRTKSANDFERVLEDDRNLFPSLVQETKRRTHARFSIAKSKRTAQGVLRSIPFPSRIFSENGTQRSCVIELFAFAILRLLLFL